MKPALQFRGTIFALLTCSLLLLGETRAMAQALSLKRVVELALTHSTASASAANDQQRAFAAMREARNQYIPQAVGRRGIGIGCLVGVPAQSGGRRAIHLQRERAIGGHQPRSPRLRPRGAD